MSEEMMQTSPFECPAWFDGKKINETVFCEEFLRDYPMVTVNDAFFTVNGRVHDENRLKKVIYDRIKYYVTSGVAKKVTNLLDVMRMECCTAKLFKQMARLNKQHDKLAELLSDMKFTNYKERSAQIAAFLEKYIPDVAAMETQMKKYKKFFKTADGKQKALEKKNDELTAALEKSEKESTVKKLQEMRLHSDYERIKGILDRIPPEIIRAYTHRDSKTQEVRHYR